MKILRSTQWITGSKLKWLFVILLVVTLIILQIMIILNQPLKNEAAPLGILSFEFAGKISVAQEMIKSLNTKEQIYAGINLGFDYIFLLFYSLTIALGCILVTRHFSYPGRLLFNFGVLLAYAQVGAAILDSIENYALIKILLGAQREIFAVLAYWCAVPKFVIVAAGIGYICFVLVLIISRKLVGQNEIVSK